MDLIGTLSIKDRKHSGTQHKLSLAMLTVDIFIVLLSVILKSFIMLKVNNLSVGVSNQIVHPPHTHTLTHPHLYIYMCVCVCV
jgi:hypothetical protein